MVVKLLLQYKDALKIDVRDAYGNTALHLACEEDRQDEALLLVQSGADLEVCNKEKHTPIDLCNNSLAKLLVNAAKKT